MSAVLTSTGKTFAVLAVILTVTGWLMHYPALLALGLACIVALAAATIWVVRRPRVRAVRELQPERVTVDQRALSELRITKSNFPGASEADAKRYLATLRAAVTKTSWPVSVQALQANLAITQARSKQKAQPVKNDLRRIVLHRLRLLLRARLGDRQVGLQRLHREDRKSVV